MSATEEEMTLEKMQPVKCSYVDNIDPDQRASTYADAIAEKEYSL